MKILIAYYSRADENYIAGRLENLEVGNTEVAARFIQEITGGELFKIRQAKPYSKGYNACITEAKDDQKRNARPELKKYPDSISEYDIIYLGYPNYWSTMPMAVFTFLEKLDLTGKIIKPFCTHEGSGLGNSVSDIKRQCPKSEIGSGLAIKGSTVSSAKDQIEKWIKE